jgi:Gas vesicle protein K
VTHGRDSFAYHGPGAGEQRPERQGQWGNTEPGTQRETRRRIRLDADPGTAQKDLAALVLTMVELLRQLMERQALRRVEDGSLTDDQIENIGSTLMALDARMTELTEHFGLTVEDLNLDLGPLGPLLSRD